MHGGETHTQAAGARSVCSAGDHEEARAAQGRIVDSRPYGHRLVPHSRGGRGELERVAHRGLPLRLIRAQVREPLSIVVPTRDRTRLLDSSPASLGQALGPDDELLVVASASRQALATAGVAGAHGAHLLRCDLVAKLARYDRARVRREASTLFSGWTLSKLWPNLRAGYEFGAADVLLGAAGGLVGLAPRATRRVVDGHYQPRAHQR
jgi:hypothetical protein